MSWNLPRFVHVREDGPRDGFQNESQFIATDQKLAMINALLETGLRRLEVTSFVHPKWIPQLVDGDEVIRRVNQRPGVTYAVLVPNQRGLERAVQARVNGARIDELTLTASATDGHSRANLNRTVEQTLLELGGLIGNAKAAGFRTCCSISVSFGCPFEGRVAPERVVEIATEMAHLGCDEISFADTIGAGNPAAVRDLFGRARRALSSRVEIGAHFHNSRGQGLANVLAALEEGITSFDASFGELGGCPYAPGAAGNIATEDLVCMLHEMGVETGVDLEKLVDCARMAQRILGRDLPSHVLRAGPMNWRGEANP